MLSSQMAAVQSPHPYASTLKAQEIRVALLLPGQWDDEISCRLINSSLESPLEYEALSYVWAQEPGHRFIRLNASLHKVTTNLFLALRRLRKTTEARPIWIDALCINQDNGEEKNHQVALMRSIYKSCTRALLWLGDYESAAGSPRQTLTIEKSETQSWKEISKEQSGMQDKGFAVMNTVHEISVNKHISATSISEEDAIYDKIDDLHYLRSLRTFIELPWWARVWTIQEAVLPSRATVIYGSFAVEWEVFKMAETSYVQHIKTCCSSFWIEVRNKKIRFDLTWTLTSFMHLVRGLRNAEKTRLLHRILWDHRCCQASEPRDLFYGLLGLVGEIVPTPTVDYRIPCEAVFKIATLLSIQQTGKLYILQRRKNFQVRKPFWIYNFDTVVDLDDWMWERGLMIREGYFFTAAGITKSVASWSNFEQSYLNLKGLFRSKVVLVGDFLPGDSSERTLRSTLIQWESLANEFYSNRTTDTPYGRDWISEYLRTILSDIVIAKDDATDFKRLCTANLPIIRRVVQNVTGMDQLPTSNLFLTSIGVSIINRAFFITSDGYMGLGCPDVGDEIWVLFGGDTPFILRPSVSDPGCHQLIASCYVHGLMDGEAMVDVEAKQQTVSLC